MTLRKLTVLAPVLAVLSACSPTTVSNLSAVPQQTLMDVQVVVDPPASAQSLGTVRVTRCRNDLSEYPTPEVTILNGMKAETQRRGGNAVRVIGYRMGVTQWSRCWHTITGRAEMYRL
ncbi:hypothetical protein LUX29_15225 [Aureimonas altamirensis]|uniref:hypothetical protein n=1 Tax=Aureimonas altamirensis TaxID=370622 RepID=UPI001E53F78F|nr:hypothetical protein [Aureimonas altamirensis]UHD44397.1 hypothetical protein LUX29_15225 [Aureimonas altamirensis]